MFMCPTLFAIFIYGFVCIILDMSLKRGIRRRSQWVKRCLPEPLLIAYQSVGWYRIARANRLNSHIKPFDPVALDCTLRVDWDSIGRTELRNARLKDDVGIHYRIGYQVFNRNGWSIDRITTDSNRVGCWSDYVVVYRERRGWNMRTQSKELTIYKYPLLELSLF